MELGIDINKIRDIFSWQYLQQFFLKLIFKFGRIIMFLSIIIITIFFVYFWYSYIYNPKWDEFKKQEYIRNKEKGVIFDKTNFENVTKETDLRDQEFQTKLENVEDIFRLKK